MGAAAVWRNARLATLDPGRRQLVGLRSRQGATTALCSTRHQAGLAVRGWLRTGQVALALLVPAAAQGTMLGSSSLANGSESDIIRADRQVAWTDEVLECGNPWKADWENLCRVEDIVIACSHIGSNHRNAKFVTLPRGLVGGCSAFEIAPASALVFFRWSERVVVAVKVEPSPSPRRWQTCLGRAHSFLHGAFKPFIWVGNFIEVSRADAINGVAGGRFADVLHAQSSGELKSIPIPAKRSQFVDGNWTIEKSLYCEPWPQVAGGNLLRVDQCFCALFDGMFSRQGACLSGLCGNSGVVERADYETYTDDTDPARHESPENLIFGRFRSAPGYAKVGLMAVLGWLASTLVNEGGIRAFRNRRQGKVLFAAGLLCIGCIVCAALMFS